ncbi:Golgin subfamily A member 7/ERF4 family [Geosmithia morbida]|uniref:Ras modification protein ERF4 n=1 Tax=Geosmithia morbida TaxID=1094350 RepID=A0A9P4YQH4_9HYPO|nr:Golgin subfamily A member 7/ERF4 family [Geosmithia morbida]KAF4121253.1 Golgin subfamily A member 7/ERF4 family [Geosmithia morbida]
MTRQSLQIPTTYPTVTFIFLVLLILIIITAIFSDNIWEANFGAIDNIATFSSFTLSPPHRQPRSRLRAGDCVLDIPTAPHAPQPSWSAVTSSAPVTVSRNRGPEAALDSQIVQPPSHVVLVQQRSTPAAADATAAAVAATAPSQRSFRKLAYIPRRSRRAPASRLWNPTNSTPRSPNPSAAAAPTHTQRKRRVSTPPPPSLPLEHPALDTSADAADPVGTGSADYPLLTLPQVFQLRNQNQELSHQRNSIQAERRASNDHRISLPSSVRASYDGKRSQGATPTVLEFPRELKDDDAHDDNAAAAASSSKDRKGKGKEPTMADVQDKDTGDAFSRDLERGPDGHGHYNRQSMTLDENPPRHSTVSAIGSAISSSDSSIMGEDVHADEDSWGPQHPCYPHLNPHVPPDSPAYISTRIIRIKRDWMIEGDLAPTFSNLYPEILDPAGLPEHEFRRIIETLNGELIPIFNPYSVRNIIDGLMGLVTGWLWDDFGLTMAKSRLEKLEGWIQAWNRDMRKTMGSQDGIMAPQIIGLRQSGYMTLDIQIPDPEIAAAPPSTSGEGHGSTTAAPVDPSPVSITV